MQKNYLNNRIEQHHLQDGTTHEYYKHIDSHRTTGQHDVHITKEVILHNRNTPSKILDLPDNKWQRIVT